MSLSKEEIWSRIELLVNEEGLGLFDLDVPASDTGVLRVFLCKRDGTTKDVGLHETTRVARKINELPDVELLIPGNATLEVSSPGINRHLTRREHFKGAISERVKLTVVRSELGESGRPKREVIRGVIVAADDSGVELEKEAVKGSRKPGMPSKKEGAGREHISFEEIQDARVDFIFE